MRTLMSRSRSWILISGILCLVLAFAALAFGQQQTPQQNPPQADGPMDQPGARGPMEPGMMPGPAMRGSGMAPGAPDMGPRESIAELLRPEIQKELAVTAEQRQKLNDIQFNSEKESIQHHAALQVLRLELAHMADADNPDRAAIDKKIQETSQEEAALMRSSMNTRLNARAVLTAEQRTKLAQLMSNPRKVERPGAAGNQQPNRRAPMSGQPKQQLPMPPASGQPLGN